MSKGLEELKDLKNAFIGHCRELKCEENYIKVCENKFSKIEKELKALDIIKEKKVEVGELLENDTFVDYNETVFYTYPDKRSDKEHNPYTYILTQEEFDLLKEVLL